MHSWNSFFELLRKPGRSIALVTLDLADRLQAQGTDPDGRNHAHDRVHEYRYSAAGKIVKNLAKIFIRAGLQATMSDRCCPFQPSAAGP